MKKGQDSRDVSPKFKTEVESAKNTDRTIAFKTLLEENARWNSTRRDTSANDIRRIVDKTSTINTELRKELLYSWEYGFMEDKPEELEPSTNLLRRDENRKSGKALTNPLKGKVVSETPHTQSKQLQEQYIEKVTLPRRKLIRTTRGIKARKRNIPDKVPMQTSRNQNLNKGRGLKEKD